MFGIRPRPDAGREGRHGFSSGSRFADTRKAPVATGPLELILRGALSHCAGALAAPPTPRRHGAPGISETASGDHRNGAEPTPPWVRTRRGVRGKAGGRPGRTGPGTSERPTAHSTAVTASGRCGRTRPGGRGPTHPPWCHRSSAAARLRNSANATAGSSRRVVHRQFQVLGPGLKPQVTREPPRVRPRARTGPAAPGHPVRGR